MCVTGEVDFEFLGEGLEVAEEECLGVVSVAGVWQVHGMGRVFVG